MRRQTAQANAIPPLGQGDFSKAVILEAQPPLPTTSPLEDLSTPLQEFGREPGFSARREAVLAVRPAEYANAGVVFSVTGSGVLKAVATRGLRVSVRGGSGGAGPADVRVQFDRDQPGADALQFSDGSGTVLAALPRFSGAILVQEGGVGNVSFTSSDRPYDRDRLEGLRATVAAAASIGAFRLASESEADRFGDRIRVEKRIDPTLGLYAAYAYTQASSRSALCWHRAGTTCGP